RSTAGVRLRVLRVLHERRNRAAAATENASAAQARSDECAPCLDHQEIHGVLVGPSRVALARDDLEPALAEQLLLRVARSEVLDVVGDRRVKDDGGLDALAVDRIDVDEREVALCERPHVADRPTSRLPSERTDIDGVALLADDDVMAGEQETV